MPRYIVRMVFATELNAENPDEAELSAWTGLQEDFLNFDGGVLSAGPEPTYDTTEVPQTPVA